MYLLYCQVLCLLWLCVRCIERMSLGVFDWCHTFGSPVFGVLVRYLATSARALPPARMFTTALSAAQMGIARWTSAAPVRCCIRRPEGPLALALSLRKLMKD